MKILVANDDGINSVGIDVIARNAQDWGEITVISPKSQQTASGKALTFHKPIRIDKTQTVSGVPAFSYNTVPADSVIIFQHLKGTPEIVLSGLNAGENTSIHSILTSGTCAVAIEAGMKDIPSFAFSIDTPEMYFFKDEIPGNIELAGKLSIKIVQKFMEVVDKKFWKEVIFVNINFPDTLNENTEIVLCDLETHKYDNFLHEREDPKGDKYYWLWGNKISEFREGSDSKTVCVDKKISITPVSMTNHDFLYRESQKVIDQL